MLEQRIGIVHIYKGNGYQNVAVTKGQDQSVPRRSTSFKRRSEDTMTLLDGLTSARVRVYSARCCQLTRLLQPNHGIIFYYELCEWQHHRLRL